MWRAAAVGTVVLALTACDGLMHKRSAESPNVGKSRLEQGNKACASQLTYARLKEYVFDEAAQIANSDPRKFDSLAAYSVVRMDQPLVKSRDDDLNVVVCSGTFVLNLPPGVQDAFNGRPVISADVEYAAQAAADGSGLVYSMNGAEPIIYRLATLGMPPGAKPPSPSLAEADEGTVAHVSPPEVPAQRTSARPPENPIAQAARPKPGGGRPAAAATEQAAAPSFNCRRARTTTERMVCGNGSLAAADRRMSAVFYDTMARADPRTKSALRRSRDEFLRRREQCSSSACVAAVYEQRVAQIRQIAGAER